jgi:hypothetical protein
MKMEHKELQSAAFYCPVPVIQNKLRLILKARRMRSKAGIAKLHKELVE